MIREIKTKKTILVLTSTLFCILLFGYIFLNLTKNTQISTHQAIPTPSISKQVVKIYESSDMDLLVEIPNSDQIQEKFNVLTISSENGVIRISRAGTNFENLDGYIKSLEKLNRIKFFKISDLNINGLSAQVGMIEDEKIYFIYIDNIVYSLSSTDTNIYPDLDQIAQSFRYTP